MLLPSYLEVVIKERKAKERNGVAKLQQISQTALKIHEEQVEQSYNCPVLVWRVAEFI